MPNGNQSMQSLPLLQSSSAAVGGSIASLQSETEDDMQGRYAGTSQASSISYQLGILLLRAKRSILAEIPLKVISNASRLSSV